MKVDFLEVVRKVAQSQNIQMTVFNKNMQELPEFDLGIRHYFQHEEAKKYFFKYIYKLADEKKLYVIKDFFLVEYCLIPLPEEENGDYLLLGPYQEEVKSHLDILAFMEKYRLAKEYQNELKEYFNVVPVVADMGVWENLCVIWYRLLYPDIKGGQTVYIRMDQYGQVFGEIPHKDILSFKLIEERYQHEAEVMKAISKGDIEAALSKLNISLRYKLEARYKDPVREIRNGLVILNTLFRKSVEMGGVPPAHIDELSTAFAKKIEMVTSKTDSQRLQREMVRKYCMLVKNYSLSSYSPIIQDVVKYINLNLAEDLSLSSLAMAYGINSSYLSTLFKKELGMTLTDYVAQQRVRRAILLLNATNVQIQDIAAECGIYDVNYFRKIFKKVIGITPTEYVKQIRHQAVIDETN